MFQLATALYKAGVAARIAADDAEIRIADLTGGLGVDSWAFAGKAGAVFGLAPLSHDSQLFVRASGSEAPSSALFECFEVIDTEPLCSSGLRAFAQ